MARRPYEQKMSILVAFATNDQCLQELHISMSYNVQETFLPKGFCRRLRHLKNIPERQIKIGAKAIVHVHILS